MDSKAVDEGIDAYCARQQRRACPYQLESLEREDWLRGWDEAEELDFEEGLLSQWRPINRA